MSELEQAIDAARSAHLARLTGPQTCCVKVGPGNMPCGQLVEYLEAGKIYPIFTGWHHVEPISDHHAVPASLIR